MRSKWEALDGAQRAVTAFLQAMRNHHAEGEAGLCAWLREQGKDDGPGVIPSSSDRSSQLPRIYLPPKGRSSTVQPHLPQPACRWALSVASASGAAASVHHDRLDMRR